MIDPRHLGYDRRVRLEYMYLGTGIRAGPDETHAPDWERYQHPFAGDHGPDADERVDMTESDVGP